MHYGYGWWGGWWIWVIWILIVVWIFALWIPGSRGGGSRPVRGTPIEELKHRLAQGEITAEEYEARLALLRRDRSVR